MKRILLALSASLLLAACAVKPTPVIFDTDMGNDIDDALALFPEDDVFRTDDDVDLLVDREVIDAIPKATLHPILKMGLLTLYILIQSKKSNECHPS